VRSVHLRVLGSTAMIVAAVWIAAAVARRAAISSVAQPSVPSLATSALRTALLPSVASSPSVAAVMDPAPLEPARCPPEPALEVRAADLPPATELLRLAQEQPEALGSASIGSPTRGALFGGVEMKNSEGILRAGAYGWGTELVIRSIERAVREVRRCFPGSPSLYVGDIARERGGWLRPHRSHQSGRDADIGYYYRTPATWYQRATAETLDVARTWALVRALVEGGNVEMIFMDVSIQRLVQAHIATLPQDARPPEDLFESPAKKDTIIRHAWAHATHFHVRFQDPAAVALGQRLADMLPRLRATHRAPARSAPLAPKPGHGAFKR
jgi:murein endopeptidase